MGIKYLQHGVENLKSILVSSPMHPHTDAPLCLCIHVPTHPRMHPHTHYLTDPCTYARMHYLITQRHPHTHYLMDPRTYAPMHYLITAKKKGEMWQIEKSPGLTLPTPAPIPHRNTECERAEGSNQTPKTAGSHSRKIKNSLECSFKENRIT